MLLLKLDSLQRSLFYLLPSLLQGQKNKMAAVPGQLIWEIVKRNNSFLVKEFGRGTAGVQFSKEPNNLYNLNSYKHSGKSS